MSDITCPRCDARLRIRAGTRDRVLICPRCLRTFDNPDADVDVRRRGVAADVGGDVGIANIVLGVLIGLCVLGIALVFATKPGTTQGFDPILTMMGLFVLLDFLVIAAVTLVVWRRLVGHEPTAGNVLGAVALSIGVAFGVVIFFFVVCFALVVAR